MNGKALTYLNYRALPIFCLLLLGLLLGGCRSRPAQEIGGLQSDTERVAPPTFTPTPAPHPLGEATVAVDAAGAGVPLPQPTDSLVLEPTPTSVPATVAEPQAQPAVLNDAAVAGAPSVAATLTEVDQAMRNGDYAAAQSLLAELVADDTLGLEQQAIVNYLLARSALANGNPSQALQSLDQLASVAAFEYGTLTVEPASVLLLRGQALEALGRPDEALQAYADAIAERPELSETVELRRAALLLRRGDGDAAAAAYRRAADSLGDSDEQRVALVGILENLAVTHEGLGQYSQAAAAYDEILTIARNAPYRTEILYKAGLAFAADGNETEAVSRWQAATTESPESQAAYLALVELVNRDVGVDLYWRGYIDLWAGAWLPAINAFQGYLEQNDLSADQTGQTLLGLGQSYLGLSDPVSAQPYFERVINEFPDCPCFGQAWLDLARVQALQGDSIGARRIYRTFAREHAADPLAAEALWLSGLSALAEQNEAEAGLDLLTLVDMFPESERAPQALYAIAIGALETGLNNQAASVLERLVQEYPDYRWDAVAYWLGRIYHAQGEPDAGDAQWQRLVERAPDIYYGVLAAEGLRDAPVTGGAMLENVQDIIDPAGGMDGDDGSKAFAETWLATWIEDDAAGFATIPAALLDDSDWNAGRLLLAADLRSEALAAFARVVERNRDNPRVLYALSMELADLGVFNLSITSMTRLLHLAPIRLVEDAPLYLQMKVYPRPFMSLIPVAADGYDISPALFYSLIRQESLFESGAQSSAAAQGLAQIIPDTGQWVADRVGYPDYVNSLLFLPMVNVEFGAYYLDWARGYLDGNLVSALVGYNAGPGNAERWRIEAGTDDVLYVELLEYTEPRVYVQAILSNLYHYERLYPDLSTDQ